MENYETLGTIGEGTYGVVLKARHKETGQIVAIKKFKESDEDEQVRKTALREVRILKQLKHDNIVNLIEVFRRKSKLHLVFEYVERTILEDLERNPDGMDPIETKKCLWQLLRSIDYCHAHNIIHRDIKPENLLISRNGILKLCDFGFARTLAGPGARYTDYVATRWYRGPELLTGDTQYGKAVDIWAIGCMLPEMASGAPLFPGESDIDQLFHIMRCFGQLPPKLLEVFRANPLFIGIKIPDNIQQTETLEERFPNYPREQLEMMKDCLRYEPDARRSCEELMAHRYFTEDGFIQWFDEELKQMLDRDAAEFKMRQKKFRKSKGRAESRGNDSDSRPQSQPPAAVPAPPEIPSIPPYKPKQQQAPPMPPPPEIPPYQPSTYYPAGAAMEAPEEPPPRREPGALPLQPLLGSRDTYASHTGSGDLGPPPFDLPEEGRRPTTRGSECGGGSGATEFGTEEMPMLPNLQRPTTPRAQRLVAFPQLASALEDQAPTMPMGNARNWGAQNMSMPPQIPPPLGKGKRVSGEAMPSLSQAMAPSALPGVPGGSNLPQLKEGQLFAAELPDRYPGGPPLAHAPVPASRGGGGSKKKASAYDPSNPYFSKPPGKSKSKGSKSSNSHGIDRGGPSSSGSGQMGVFGHSHNHSVGGNHSMAGLAGAYALPPSQLPPRTPNHDYDPPRTPAGDNTSVVYTTSYASGGMYAKYGKRY